MTDEQLEQIRERAEKATPGPWRGLYLSGDFITGVRTSSTAAIGLAEEPFTNADKSFICHAREDIPALLAEVERWRNVVDEIQEFVVAHAFDTTVGRKIDDFITERLKALASDALQ